MARVVVLDSTPLGLASLPPGSPRLASGFWVALKAAGLPTAPDNALDADVILAAQASLAGGSGDVATLATSNVRHLSRFPGLDARESSSILP